MYGVRPANYLAFAALRGDASDNLPGVQGIGEKTAAILLEVAGSMEAVWADVDHDEGRSWRRPRRLGRGDRCAPPRRDRRTTPGGSGARERYDFNVPMMSGQDDLDLGLTPDVPGLRGLLPLDFDRVSQVVGFLDIDFTTDFAVRVLTSRPASG